MHGAGVLPSHRRAIADILACRTQALGGHLWRCVNAAPKSIPTIPALWAKSVMGSWRPRPCDTQPVSASPSHHYEALLSMAISLSGAPEGAPPQVRRYDGFDRFELLRGVAAGIDFRGFQIGVAEPQGYLADILGRPPGRSSRRYASAHEERRRTFCNPGDFWAERPACFLSRYAEPQRLSGSPRALTNTSGAAAVPRTASHARSAVAVVFHRGSARSRRPLPRTRMLIDGRSTFSIRSPVSSDTRSRHTRPDATWPCHGCHRALRDREHRAALEARPARDREQGGSRFS